MTMISRGEKVFFAIVACSALWVGGWSYFAPAYVQNGIPWMVPPLHARVIGAIYLSAAVFCFGSIFARGYAEVRVIMPMIAIWTGVIFLVSLLHLTAADYRRLPIWIWFVAYLVYPLIALWFVWVHRSGRDMARGDMLPAWARGYFLAQGILLTAVAVLLLALPGLMIKVWPWTLTLQLAQIYAGPILCYGIASLLLGRARAYSEARIAVAGMFVFSFAVLAASILHRGIFASASVSVLLWFACLVIAVVVLGLMLAHSWRTSTQPM